jgi:hypothetical protein
MIHALQPHHPLHLITLTIYGKKYKLWRSSLCSFLHDERWWQQTAWYTFLKKKLPLNTQAKKHDSFLYFILWAFWDCEQLDYNIIKWYNYRWTEKDLEGTGHSLTELLPWHFPWKPMQNYDEFVRIPGVLINIWTKHNPNMSLNITVWYQLSTQNYQAPGLWTSESTNCQIGLNVTRDKY